MTVFLPSVARALGVATAVACLAWSSGAGAQTGGLNSRARVAIDTATSDALQTMAEQGASLSAEPRVETCGEDGAALTAPRERESVFALPDSLIDEEFSRPKARDVFVGGNVTVICP